MLVFIVTYFVNGKWLKLPDKKENLKSNKVKVEMSVSK